MTKCYWQILLLEIYLKSNGNNVVNYTRFKITKLFLSKIFFFLFREKSQIYKNRKEMNVTILTTNINVCKQKTVLICKISSFNESNVHNFREESSEIYK